MLIDRTIKAIILLATVSLAGCAAETTDTDPDGVSEAAGELQGCSVTLKATSFNMEPGAGAIQQTADLCRANLKTAGRTCSGFRYTSVQPTATSGISVSCSIVCQTGAATCPR